MQEARKTTLSPHKSPKIDLCRGDNVLQYLVLTCNDNLDLSSRNGGKSGNPLGHHKIPQKNWWRCRESNPGPYIVQYKPLHA